MNYQIIAVVAAGGAIGAVIRWFLGVGMNGIFPGVPLGTLAANMAGGLIIGFLVAIVARMPSVSPLVRAFVGVGFCGGLTAFSAFSAEAVIMFMQGRVMWAAATVLANVCGTVAMTVVGISCVSWFSRGGVVFKTLS
jgi:CrcB protein